MKQTLSIVVSAYNEEERLSRCLSSVRGIADEIIVVDNESQDDTAKVAGKFTKNVFTKENVLMLNQNKNFGFTKATGDWILNLDADEEMPPELGKEIQEVIESKPKENGYWIKRKNFSFGKWIQHGLWWPDKQIRLFRKGSGSFPCVHIHEYIKVDGKVGELSEPYHHYNYESVHQYLTKIDRASASEAISLKEMNYRLQWFDAIRFPVSDFLKIYFAQEGYKDGLHGLVLALFQSLYSFATFTKYWEMQKFQEEGIALHDVEKELEKQRRDVWYWVVSAKIKETSSFLNRVILKLKRKLCLLHA